MLSLRRSYVAAAGCTHYIRIMQFHFDNSYAALPERFFARVRPAPVTAPRLIKINRNLADELRLDADWLASDDGVQVLAGKDVPDEAAPIAAAYAGTPVRHISCRSSATGGRCCSAKSSTATASAATSS